MCEKEPFVGPGAHGAQQWKDDLEPQSEEPPRAALVHPVGVAWGQVEGGGLGVEQQLPGCHSGQRSDPRLRGREIGFRKEHTRGAGVVSVTSFVVFSPCSLGLVASDVTLELVLTECQG